MAEESNKRKIYWKWIRLIAMFTVPGVIALMLVRQFLFQPFSAPTWNNVPNLLPGDVFIVDKTAYFSAEPRRGDLAIFRGPQEPHFDLVMRVVGLPGEQIQLKAGILNIDGVPVGHTLEEVSQSIKQEFPARYFRETLPGGRSYVIADANPTGALDSTEIYTVPSGQYFCLGDNRDNSMDSRIFGFVPRENFIGTVKWLLSNSEELSTYGRPVEVWSH